MSYSEKTQGKETKNKSYKKNKGKKKVMKKNKGIKNYFNMTLIC